MMQNFRFLIPLPTNDQHVRQNPNSKSLRYQDAGVNIDAEDQFVADIA